MAGKSTFLRQNALIAMLAQMGSFVPAAGGADRGGRPAVQPGRRGRRPGARAVDLHGGDGRDRGDPEPGRAAGAGDPRRDRAGHRDLRRAVDRLGGARASARRQPLPGAVRHALPRADRARGEAAGACATPPWRCASGRARWCSCTRCRRGRRTAPTGCRWRGSPGCRRRWSSARGWCWRRWSAASAEQGGKAQGAGRRPAAVQRAPRRPPRPPRVRSCPRSRRGCARCMPDELSPREALALVYELRALLPG